MTPAIRIRFVLTAIMTAAVSSGCQTLSDRTNDSAELKRTWDAAYVYLPADGLDISGAVKLAGPGGSWAYRLVMKPDVRRGSFEKIPESRRYPFIVYMHGCKGITGHNSQAGIFLAGTLGIAVIQPVSFARNYRPSNCDPATKSGGNFRGAIDFRIAEANFAIREARKLPWIDPENVILMGHSEGGITTSKFTGESVNARIVEGATCHYGWPDWSGLDAPETEPVLALLGANDPWQVGKPWWGEHCGSLISKSNGSRSIVVNDGEYANQHEVLFDPEVKNTVMAFIKAHMKIATTVPETKVTARSPAAGSREAATKKTGMNPDYVRATGDEMTVGKTVTSEVPARSEQWLDLGVRVERGQTYKISASGSWTVNSKSCGWSGPDGGSGPCSVPLSFPQAFATSYSALIGRIGDGPVFLVGSGIRLTADRSGSLNLRINDAPGGFKNNEGSVTVQITRVSNP